MWFKNLQLYRLPAPWNIDLAKLEEQLARGPFVKCPSNQPLSRGWIAPRRDGALVFALGRQWLLVGLGVSLYAAGDIAWTLFDLFLGIDPYPSIADVFYTAEYVFFFAAIALAIHAYSGLVKTRTPMLIGGAVAVVGIAVVYFALLAPYIFPAGTEELGFWGLVVSTTYPVADIALMLAPAVALALVVRQLGAGRLARPWWLVVVGVLVFAAIDSLFVYADWAGTGLTPIVDVGYVVANLLFACAALVAKDAYRVS